MNLLNNRASGVLMHISSLPGNTGIGTLGTNAFAFIDYLKKYGQTYWQILPIGPTGYGDSPYQSFSTFAGNPYFIDLDKLCADGYLAKSDYENVDWGCDKTRVDFGKLYVERTKIFNLLHENFKKNIPCDYADFCAKESWLNDYALYMAIKDAHNGQPFYQWEDDIKCRKAEALESWAEKCSDRVDYYKMLQYFFFKQWNELKAYAAENGIKIIGDIPIYVASDSSDVWSSPKEFSLDEKLNPVEVAGCPPDAFSATGQLWGNPVYNWEYMKTTGFAWWKKRLEQSLKFYDVIRIDHFRGFDSFYCIPYGANDAIHGEWKKGPGKDLFDSIKETFGDLPIIAEDLGFLTDSVRELLKYVGFPGMKILQFAFDTRDTAGGYLPHQHIKNSVVYVGTHDNDTILGWTKSARAEDVAYSKKYLRAESDEELCKEMMISALASVSNTCILTMQDLIGLDSSARMNAPSSVGTNWQWRATQEQISSQKGEFLSYYTKLYSR